MRRARIKQMAEKLIPRSLYRLIRPYCVSGNRDEHWIRQVLNRETEKWIAELGPEKLDVFEVSGDDWQDKLPFKSHKFAFYPEYDVCERPYEGQYDLVVAEQVFEHLLWPYRAARNVLQMLRPGGYFLVTTPFLVRVHAYPNDCTRWTPQGMKHFLAEAGFPIEGIRVDAWGNRKCAVTNFTRWQIYQPWRHSLVNEPDYPVVVWALARKQGGESNL